jgi:hypothetical protein
MQRDAKLIYYLMKKKRFRSTFRKNVIEFLAGERKKSGGIR